MTPRGIYKGKYNTNFIINNIARNLQYIIYMKSISNLQIDFFELLTFKHIVIIMTSINSFPVYEIPSKFEISLKNLREWLEIHDIARKHPLTSYKKCELHFPGISNLIRPIKLSDEFKKKYSLYTKIYNNMDKINILIKTFNGYDNLINAMNAISCEDCCGYKICKKVYNAFKHTIPEANRIDYEIGCYCSELYKYELNFEKIFSRDVTYQRYVKLPDEEILNDNYVKNSITLFAYKIYRYTKNDKKYYDVYYVQFIPEAINKLVSGVDYYREIVKYMEPIL